MSVEPAYPPPPTPGRRFDLTEEVDVVVVGTGAGGAHVLAALAGRGLRVVALEAGRWFAPREHTPDETEATELNWMEERLSGGETPTAFGPNNSGRGVGGSTLHWGAFVPRPDPRDLRLRSTTGEGVDWPIQPAELADYLRRVEAALGVSGPQPYPWDPDRRYPLPPVPRNGSARLMAAGCAALGIRATDAPAAVVSRDWAQPGWGLRQGCVGCGGCHQGCRNGAKVSMDTSLIPLALHRGAEVRAEATVHGVERGADGRVTAVVYRQHGEDRRQRCAALFLCAGGVETPRLLLHAGLALGSGQVGRSFMAHGGVQVWGRFDTEVRSHRGYPSSLITEDFVRPEGAGFAGGYLVQSLGVQPGTWGTTVARSGLWGQPLVDALDGYGWMAGVGINGECLPREQNRLTLAEEVDAVGVPKARIDFSAGPNEEAIDAHATRVLTSILEAAGARSTMVLPRTAHTLGTCRMGTDPATSVVDPDGRSHEVANLWVADSSVFPSSLAANPGLTTMALGLRAADRFWAEGR